MARGYDVALHAGVVVRVASCSCGQLVVTCDGEAVRVSLCHCLACQRRTGSVFGVQARFERRHVTFRGTSTSWVRVGDEGGRFTFHFCPTCGATVYYESDREPDLVAIAVGAFADPTFPAPRLAVYEARRHPWTTMPELHAERWDRSLTPRRPR